MRETKVSNKTLARIRMSIGGMPDHLACGNAITIGEMHDLIYDIEALQDNVRHYKDAEAAQKAAARLDKAIVDDVKSKLVKTPGNHAIGDDYGSKDDDDMEPFFDYVQPSIDAVIAGLQDFEQIYA